MAKVMPESASLLELLPPAPPPPPPAPPPSPPPSMPPPQLSLHEAAQFGHHEILQMLEARASPNELDGIASPLHHAARNGQSEMIALLSQFGANMEAMTSMEVPTSMKQGSHDLKHSIQSRPDIDYMSSIQPRPESLTTLHLAIYKGHCAAIRELFQQRADISAKTGCGLNAVHLATQQQNCEVLELLFELKADVNAKTEEYGQHNELTSLHLATQNMNCSVIRLLFQFRADVNAKTEDKGLTPLHLATPKEYHGVIELLSELKADTNARTKENLTPLHLATLNGHIAMIELLSKLNADMDAKDTSNNSALMLASRLHKCQTGVLQALLDAGANKNTISVAECMEFMLRDDSNAARFIDDLLVMRNERLCGKETYMLSATHGPRTFVCDSEDGSEEVHRIKTQIYTNQKAKQRLTPGKKPPSDYICCSGRSIKCKANVYSSRIRNLCCQEVVGSIASASERAPCFSHPLVHAILNQTWQTFQIAYWCHGVLPQILKMSLVMSMVETLRTSTIEIDWRWYASAGITVKEVAGELCQLCQTRFQEGKSKDRCAVFRYLRANYLDLWALVADIIAHKLLIANDITAEGNEFYLFMVGIWAAMQWYLLMASLRGFRTFGLSMLPIIRATLSTGPFFIIFFMALMALSSILYVMATRDPLGSSGLGSSHLYAAWLPIYRLALLGDMDIFELEGTDVAFEKNDDTWEPQDPAPTRKYIYVHAIFIAASLCLTTVLMQLLVGILGSEYVRHQDKALQSFLHTRARLICRLNSMPWIRSWAWKPHEGFLWFAVRDDGLPEEVCMVSLFKSMDQKLSQMDSKVSARLGDMDQKLNQILEKFASCENMEKLGSSSD